jgi:sodium/potassium/calcium exchanger 6
VTYGGVATLLSLYAAYVVVVAVADFSHRAGVRWASVGQNLASRLSLRFSRPELAAPLLRWAAAGGGDDAAAGGGELQAAADGAAAEAHPTVTQLQLPSPRLKPSSSGSELELMSALQRLPLGGAAQGPDRGDGGAEVQPAAAAAPPPRNHPLPSTYDLPAGRTGSGSLPYDAILHMPASEYRKRALADMAAARSFYRRGQGPGEAGESEEEGSAEELDEAELDIERGEWASGVGARAAISRSLLLGLHATCIIIAMRRPPAGPYTPPSVDQAEEGKAGPRPAPLLPVPPPPPPAHPHPPPDTGSDEAAAAALKSGPILRALDALCHPVILVLKATIPLIEPNAYERRWLLASAAAAPPFVCAYLGALRWGPLLTAAGAGAALCALCAAGTRAAGGKPPAWSAGTGSFPAGAAAVALAGFAVAAMWIDVFATEVVGLLHFLGLLAGVAPAVLGVSVLAWGNSMTDYMANTSMAARSPGGTSMAMTACYAGPLFNMLVGLGVGFWALLVDRHGSSAPVAFDPVVLVGCAFAAANCAGVAAAAARNGHRLPGRAGWAMVGWYGCYLAVVVAVVAAGV